MRFPPIVHRRLSSLAWLQVCYKLPTRHQDSFLLCQGKDNNDDLRILSRSSPFVTLRNATLTDLDLVEAWDKKEHMQASIGDYDFNDWNWKKELPRNPSWRFQLIAEVEGGIPIGFVQIIDALEEETHYWGLDCEPNLRAIDIWIGEEEYLGRGYGTQMMVIALRDYCFSDARVEAVIIDPMADNTNAHRFYQRLGFRPIGIRYFGPDKCLVHRLNRSDFVSTQWCQL